MTAELMELQQLTEAERPITYGVVKPGVEDPEKGVLFIRGGDIADGNIDAAVLRTITQEVSAPYARTILRGGEVVISLVGNPGAVAVVPESLAGANLARQVGLIALKPEHHAPYFKYYLMSPQGKAELFQRTQGAVQQVINLADLKRIKVRVLPKPEQERIANALAAYDDLIENNRRRIALLEQSIRLLYREWFVHLRFPGREHVNVVDVAPEGWGMCSALDVMDVMSGGTPKTGVSDYWDGDIPFFTPKDAVDTPYVLDTEKHLTDRGLSTCNSQLYPKDTIFITARGTVGNLNLAQVPMAMNQSCYALKGKGYLSQLFLYGALKEAVQQFKSRAGGAVFDAIVVNTFKLIPFLRPPEALVREYTELVEPMFGQIDRLLLMSARLRKARDLLLPRMMSGDLVV